MAEWWYWKSSTDGNYRFQTLPSTGNRNLRISMAVGIKSSRLWRNKGEEEKVSILKENTSTI